MLACVGSRDRRHLAPLLRFYQLRHEIVRKERRVGWNGDDEAHIGSFRIGPFHAGEDTGEGTGMRIVTIGDHGKPERRRKRLASPLALRTIVVTCGLSRPIA